MLLLSAVLVCFIKSALSGITATPGMQRTSVGKTATFQWSVAGTVSSYAVKNLWSGLLNTNANYTLDSRSGVVTLTIKNIWLTDAGNYSLSVTTGRTTQTDASALLFVYSSPTVVVDQTSGGNGQQPATEGDTVELTCVAVSYSLPAAYRPKMYVKWYLSWIGTWLQNFSGGQATLETCGDSVPGYSLKDDGKTLVIASAEYRDTLAIRCNGQEQWSPHQLNSPWFTLPLRYRPYIASRTPASKKFNAIVGDSVSVAFNFYAVPSLTSASNWSFINTAGQAQDLPANSSFSNTSSQFSLQFTFTSEAYYGNYSITLNNIIGPTTETFQVSPPGPPEAPSSVIARFVSHYLIVIASNCGWFNGHQQSTFVQLKTLCNDSAVDSKSALEISTCYNSSTTTEFQNGIQPETDYEVLLWSTNNLGSSDIVKLRVKTPKIFKLFVSSETISLNGNQAIVNFSATEDKIRRLYVQYCLELTGDCNSYDYYNVNSTEGQITCDNLPPGDVFVFDFKVYGGYPNIATYYLTMVKGVRVSRNEDAEGHGSTTEPCCEKASTLLIATNDPETKDENTNEPDHIVGSTDIVLYGPTASPVGEKSNNLLTPVIVLAVLLGVAVLALIVCLIYIFVSKCRQKRQLRNTHQTLPTTPRNNKAYEEDDPFEGVDDNTAKSDAFSTDLEEQRYC